MSKFTKTIFDEKVKIAFNEELEKLRVAKEKRFEELAREEASRLVAIHLHPEREDSINRAHQGLMQEISNLNLS